MYFCGDEHLLSIFFVETTNYDNGDDDDNDKKGLSLFWVVMQTKRKNIRKRSRTLFLNLERTLEIYDMLYNKPVGGMIKRRYDTGTIKNILHFEKKYDLCKIQTLLMTFLKQSPYTYSMVIMTLLN